MTQLRRFALILAAAAALAGQPAAAQVAGPAGFAPAAFVNDQVITAYDLDQRRRMLAMSGGQADEAQALDSLISSRLKRAAAAEAGIEANPQEVQAGLERFTASLGLSADTLQGRLKQAGVSRVALRDYVETEVMWTGYVRRSFMGRAQVTDAQLEDELANSDRLVRRAFDLSEIGMPFGNDQAGVMARAADISARINAGEDSAALARRFSQSPSRAKGGRVGLVPENRVPQPMREQLMALQPGQATQPIPVPRGVVVLVLHDIKTERAEVTPDLREQVRQRMLEERLSRLADGRLDELRAEAFIERGR